VSSSVTTSAITSGWRSSSIIAQDAVPLLVWWPANIIEMKMPVMTSASNWSEPSSFRSEMRTSRRSRSSLATGPRALRRSMIPCTSATSFSLAVSRIRKLSMSA
jgi:hypothetical protein